MRVFVLYKLYIIYGWEIIVYYIDKLFPVWTNNVFNKPYDFVMFDNDFCVFVNDFYKLYNRIKF